MFKILSPCFSLRKVNTERQVEFDIAKGFAIVFMVLAHVYMDLSDWSNSFCTLLIYDIWGGPFAAPVFMFCMGIGIGYSKKKSPKDLFIRGLRLISLALTLDLFRYVLPALIFESMHGSVSLKAILLDSFGIDILQFSGLFFIVFSILMNFHFNHRKYILFTLLLSLLGQLLNGVSFSNSTFNILTSFFWRSASFSYFPLFNWSIFPIAGYLFSDYILYCHNKDKFYSTIFPVSSIISAIFLILFIIFWSNDNEYYGMSLLHAILELNFTITIISFCHITFHKKSLFVRSICWMSQNVTKIYCIHWIIIMTLYYIFVEYSYAISSYAVIPFGLFITAVSCLIIYFWNRCLALTKYNRVPHSS